MTVIGRYFMFMCAYFTYKDALLGVRLRGGAGSDMENDCTLKAVFTALHQQFRMQECRRQMAVGRTAAQVKFSDAASKRAGRALVWLMKVYKKLEEVHVQSHLEQIGYMRS